MIRIFNKSTNATMFKNTSEAGLKSTVQFSVDNVLDGSGRFVSEKWFESQCKDILDLAVEIEGLPVGVWNEWAWKSLPFAPEKNPVTQKLIDKIKLGMELNEIISDGQIKLEKILEKQKSKND